MFGNPGINDGNAYCFFIRRALFQEIPCFLRIDTAILSNTPIILIKDPAGSQYCICRN